MARKVGIPFSAGLTTHGDVTGLENTISGYYRLDSATAVAYDVVGNANSWTAIGAFTEVSTGYYASAVTVPVVGLYQFAFVSTDPRIGTQEGKVEVVAASVDDVMVAVEAAQTDITTIKNKVSTLDAEVMGTISTQITGISTQVSSLASLVADPNNPAIVSLTTLLDQIQATEGTEGGVIATLSAALSTSTADLEAILTDKKFMSDGVTANPLYGHSNLEIHAAVEALAVSLTAAQTAIVTEVDNTATATQALITSKIAEVEALIVANNTSLGGSTGLGALSAKLDQLIGDVESTTFGLSAIMTGVTAVKGDTVGIIATLGDATNGLLAINTNIATGVTTIMTKLADMTNVITDIQSKTTDIQTHVDNAVPFVSVIM